MTNTQIVNDYIIESKRGMKIFNKISKNSEWADDLLSEIVLIFLEMDNDKLNNMVEKGDNSFFYYFSSIVKNQLHSSSSPFYTKYRKDLCENANLDTSELFFTDNEEFEVIKLDPVFQEHEWDSLYEDKVQQIYNKVKTELHWYDMKIFELYVERYNEKGTIRRIAEDTKIPEQSLGNTIRNAKDVLKRRITEELNNND